MVFTICFTILLLILMLFPQKTGSKTIVFAMFCSCFHLILTLIWKNLHGLAKTHQKHMGFSSISPYFDLILTLIQPYFEVIFLNLRVGKNHGFYHIVHHFTIDFDAVSTENGLKTMFFFHFLQLFSPNFDVDLKDSSWFSQKPSKTRVFFHGLVLISTLF